MLILLIFLIGMALVVIGFDFTVIFDHAKKRKLLKQWISVILMIIGVVMIMLLPIYILIWW